MKNSWKKVSAENVGSGVIKELWELYWPQILENLQDENTDPEKVRELTIKFKVKALDDKRKNLNYTVEPVVKTATAKPFAGTLVVEDGSAYENQDNEGTDLGVILNLGVGNDQ